MRRTYGRGARVTKLASAIFAPIAVVATMSQPALSQIASAPRTLFEVKLDIDKDGEADRALIVRDPASIYSDLQIYLGGGDEKLDPSRKPSFTKKELTTAPVLGLESKSGTSLVVRYGFGGSNSYENALTIVHRGGQFLVAGFSAEWDTRNGGVGACDINYLTGKGFASKGPQGKNNLLIGKFSPLTLADWSSTTLPTACL